MRVGERVGLVVRQLLPRGQDTSGSRLARALTCTTDLVTSTIIGAAGWLRYGTLTFSLVCDTLNTT